MKTLYAYNNTVGMVFLRSDMYMENISAEYNYENGMIIDVCSINMTSVSSNHNDNFGIYIFRSIETTLMNVSTVSNGVSGIQLNQANNTMLLGLSSKYNGDFGLINIGSNSTTLNDSRLAHNKRGNIIVIESTDLTIVGTAASIVVHQSSNVYWEDIVFSDMDSSSTISTVDPTSLPAIVELYNSNATVCDCSFKKNTISAIKAVGSKVTFSGEIEFSHNRALTGTALIFAKGSTLILSENSKVFFTENHASSFGGVIYISTEESYNNTMTLYDVIGIGDLQIYGSLTSSITECFICVEGSRSDKRLVFTNNTAEKGGDALYGGLLAMGWDGDWNCLLSFKNISDMSQQSGLSPITSDPSRVCFCNDSEPDCLTVAEPITCLIYPGQTITIPAVVVGQAFGTVTGSVYAKFLNTSFAVDIEEGQNVTNIDQSQCTNIDYTIFSKKEGSEAILVLTVDNIEVPYVLNESDNQEILNSWKILNSEPNYVTLASNIINLFVNYTSATAVFTEAYYESLAPENRT